MDVVQGDLEDTIVVSVSIDEFILKALHIKLIDGAHKRQCSKSKKQNLEAQLLLRLHAKLINDVDQILLLLLAK